MGQPAAKQGDRIVGMDTHLVPGGAATFPFNGLLSQQLSPNVNIMGNPAATVGSTAMNSPPHPAPVVATNMGVVLMGSTSVTINGKPAARAGDVANTCNDPAPAPMGQVVATGTVNIG